MTQEVQPLTWQKRTNIEEHQQFFSKINEIIANLAPTVDEAEQAIAQATQALTDATAAIATANAASAAADAAAQQAQTAAATVAGYNTRLSQVENKASINQANIATVSGMVAQDEQDIAALQTADGQIRNDIAALQTADGQNVKINRIDEYAVALTGNQTAFGEKVFNTPSVIVPGGWHSTYASTGNLNEIKLFAKLKNPNVGRFADIEITQSSNTAICYGVLSVHITNGYPLLWSIRRTLGSNNNMTADSMLVAVDGSTGDVYLASRKKAVYGNLMYRVMKEVFYGAVVAVADSSIEWLTNPVNIGDGTGYTLIEAVE